MSVPPPHPEEFRRRAVELARERAKLVAELAKDLRISESCRRNDSSVWGSKSRFSDPVACAEGRPVTAG